MGDITVRGGSDESEDMEVTIDVFGTHYVNLEVFQKQKNGDTVTVLMGLTKERASQMAVLLRDASSMVKPSRTP